MLPMNAAGESLQWRKTLRSIGNGNCVEVASSSTNVVVRDSKDPNGPMLTYNTESWRVFTAQARQGRFGL
jgi:Domain of unknown function (DUF397)